MSGRGVGGGYTVPTEPLWVHTLASHAIGSVIGWPSADSPTGWWSGIVRESAPCSVKVDNIRPGVMPS